MKLKRITAFCICVVMAVAMLSSCSAEKKDFRESNWGDEQAKVGKTENSDYVFANDEVMFYNDSMFDNEAEILYTFQNNILSEAQCKFVIDDKIIADLITDYERVAAEITEEYGEPISSDYKIWHTDSELYEEHKADGEHLAIYWKILEYKLEWKTETSYYSLALNYKDEQINYIFYGCNINLA